jgi:hypothetical protein
MLVSNGPAHHGGQRQLVRLLGMVRRSSLADSFFTNAPGRSRCSHLTVCKLSTVLRDCHIMAIPASEVHVAGCLLFILVRSMIDKKVVPPSPAMCPITLEMAEKSDFRAGIRSRQWSSIHPCMHWCGREVLVRWTADPKNYKCPVCRTEILFMLGTHIRKSRECA